MKLKILLLGGSGNLGSKIIKSNFFTNLKSPSKRKLNILDKTGIEKFLIKHEINLIIHCAAIARVKDCEGNKNMAKKININGTKNIISAILKIKKFIIEKSN